MQISRKSSLLLVLALALCLALAAAIWAQTKGKDTDPCPVPATGMMNLTPEQAGKIFDLREKMYTDTFALRRQMMIKHAELAALMKAEKPDQNAIQAKQQELSTLGDQMKEKLAACQAEGKKIAPDFDMGMGMAMGMGTGSGCAMGMGKGPGAGAPPPPPPAK